MTNQAQVIANIAANDFAGAIKIAFETGYKRSTGFGTMEYSFDDGSALSLRAGRIEYPQAQRIIFRDSCGDIDCKVVV